MQKIVLLCFAILHAVSALQCFYCRDSTCGTDKKTWVKMTCPMPPILQDEYICIKWSYKDMATQKTVVRRACDMVSLIDGKLGYNCQPANIFECSCCQTDLCNSAKSISFSFVALCSVVLAIATPKLW